MERFLRWLKGIGNRGITLWNKILTSGWVMKIQHHFDSWLPARGVRIKKKIVRIITKFSNGNFSTGTGFFVSHDGTLLTCFHVAFGDNLQNIRNSQMYVATADPAEETKLRTFFNAAIQDVKAVLDDGTELALELLRFDAGHDLAVLKTIDQTELSKISPFKCDFECSPHYGMSVAFAGYPESAGYTPLTNPFSFNVGNISSFPITKIAGDTYEHIQISAVNLGGNSGGPLFAKRNGKVIGIINGNMNHGADNIAYIAQNGQVVKGALRIPLSIAYATSLKLLRSEGLL